MQGGGNKAGRGFILLASFALVAAILYFAKTVFIPFALALLLTFLLSPLVVRLQKWKFPKPVAITVTATLAFAILGFLTWLVATQLLALAAELPRYEENLHAKVQQLKGTPRPGVLTRAANLIKGVEKDFQAPDESAVEDDNGDRGTREKPITVEVKAPKPTAWQMARRTLGPLLGPIGTAGIVIILVLAMLFKREDLRDRFIKVISGGHLNMATEAVDDAARRISRYLLMQLVVNVTYGLPIGLGLFFIGVPNAMLWGVLATLLRFIPFLGPWIAAAFPVAVAFAVDPGWTKLLLTISLFIVFELVSNNLVEPWLYGASTGVSPVAVIGGAIFWTWLWGPIGLFLCTPLTVCLVVMGKYVPGLQFFSDLFGSEPVLQPHARFYQRMLAMDSEEMLRIAEDYLVQGNLVAFYDEVMIPALILAEEDRQTGQLAEMRQNFIVQNSRELIEELGDRELIKRTEAENAPNRAEILCVPARDDADEIVAQMLVQTLRLEGFKATIISATTQVNECADKARRGNIQGVVISALPPAALASARRLCRQMKQSCGSLPVLVGIWTPNSAATDLIQRLATARPDGVVTTLSQAIQQLRLPCAMDQPNVESNSASESPSEALCAAASNTAATGLRSKEPAELFDGVKRQAAQILEVPLAFVSIVEMDEDFWKINGGRDREAEETNRMIRDSALCSKINGTTEPTVVEDVTRDKRLADDPFLESRGIKAYVTLPMQAQSGHTVGSLCVLDTKPRTFEADQLKQLQALARNLTTAIESHQPAAV